MKIDKLMTLSQFVDSNHTKWALVREYNNFLKQPLTKEMFVNEVKKPMAYSMYNFQRFECSADEMRMCREFEEAENKVIFEGFNRSHYYAFNYICGTIRINLQNFAFPKLEYTLNTYSHKVKTLHNLAEATAGKLKLKNVEI